MSHNPPQSFGFQFPATVVGVYDGDTIEVEVQRRLRLRILGLWCPEIRTRDAAEKRAGRAARDALRKLLAEEGRDVVITVPIEADGRFGESMSFGRVLANVQTAGGIDVAEWMIAHGHGTAEPAEE